MCVCVCMSDTGQSQISGKKITIVGQRATRIPNCLQWALVKGQHYSMTSFRGYLPFIHTSKKKKTEKHTYQPQLKSSGKEQKKIGFIIIIITHWIVVYVTFVPLHTHTV